MKANDILINKHSKLVGIATNSYTITVRDRNNNLLGHFPLGDGWEPVHISKGDVFGTFTVDMLALEHGLVGGWESGGNYLIIPLVDILFQ